ncbi:MAG: hypothetical protein PHU62_00260 [Bacteroidales bacterium]|jgi:FtsZ-binding cell division protein ZapB|nr:hypothetical protein [Bacteroidales bacterium]MDD2203897.1 hypothetical protein [Bacteroidales bacterium]MDD3153027.1 hypothetical protein [Bacteroidales bacterium]MDD3913088.1 hypothetical protein [Bacteroidales bacterium]MDD4633003.1 hypothetical protein [Bacteroidales bacterium]
MEEVNLILESIEAKVKKLIGENQELRKEIEIIKTDNKVINNNLTDEINILNNKLSEEREKQLRDKNSLKELLQEIEGCLTIYSNEIK